MSIDQTNKPKAKILIVDDMPTNRDLLRRILEPDGYEAYLVPSGEIALQVACEVNPDLVLLDVELQKGMNGFETCRQLKDGESTRDIPIIFITVRDEMESVVQGFQAGGVDYIIRPFREEEVLIRVETHLRNTFLMQEVLQKSKELQQEIERRLQAEQEREQAEDALMKADEHLALISQQEAERWGIEAFIGQSQTIRQIVEKVRLLQSREITGVLITGESGTGKELIARAIHFGSLRARGRFIPVNCSAIPSGLEESTFFGHVRGSFTGADRARRGYFELADGGTLFLDEIDDMPLELQAKLLRVIEDGCFRPVGSDDEKRVDVRILAATKVDLARKVAGSAFQSSLYFRLARFPVHVPPLRQRPGDIPLLTDHFVSLFAAEMGIQKPVLSLDALRVLGEYSFPGNVRELKNIVEYAVIRSHGDMIELEHLHFFYGDSSATTFQGPDSPPIWAGAAQSAGEDGAASRNELIQAAALLLGVHPTRIEQLCRPADPPFSQGGVEGLVDSHTAHTPPTKEEQILNYVRKHGSVTNPECRDLLSVDMDAAYYLLNKMCKQGFLQREGKLRWAKYRLNRNINGI